MTVRNPIMIITASKSNLNKTENANRNARLVHALHQTFGHSISFEPCTGMYQGESEDSYCVYLPVDPMKGSGIAIHLREIAAVFDQDSILCVDAEMNASIVYLDATESIKGPWTALPEGVPADTDDYTVIRGVTYQIGRRIDYPELEGAEFLHPLGYTLRVLGCNYDIGFTAYNIKGDPTKKNDQIVCCIGPSSPEWGTGDIERHNGFFDNCVEAAKTGVYQYYYPAGHRSGDVSCAFNA